VKASNTGAFDHFGAAVALSSDGHTLAVGAPRESSNAVGIDGDQTDNSFVAAGAVYIFVRAGATWQQQAYVKASNTDANDQFGYAIALSADGSTLAVGSPGEDGNGSTQTDNSSAQSGAVYVFVRAGVTWTQQEYVKSTVPIVNANFGISVALSADGNTLAVGAANENANAGRAYAFVRAGMVWSQDAVITPINPA